MQRVASTDIEIRYALQYEVHTGNGRCHTDQLLPVKTHRASVATVAVHFSNTRDQHTTSTAGRVVNIFAGAFAPITQPPTDRAA